MKKCNLDRDDFCIIFVKYDKDGNEINKSFKGKIKYKAKRYAVMENGDRFCYCNIKTFFAKRS